MPKGETFDARRERHGLEVYYVDDKGRARKEFYTLVAGSAPPPTAAAAPPQPAPPPPTAASAPAAAAPPATSAPAVSAPVATVAVQQAAPGNATGNVKCNFSSTPPGADITVDGKYVGSTPSEIAVSPGAHVIVISMPGFAQWTRDLTVEAGSGVVNVTASLQKTQP